MHDSGSGEIVEAHSQRRPNVAIATHESYPAIRSPSPVTDDGIDETGNGNAIKEVANKPGATDHRARGNGRASVGESKLEDPDGEKCDAGGFIGCRRALQEEPVITDEAVAMAEHEREAEGVEQQAAQTCVNHTLHENVYRLTRAAEAGLQHGEAHLHAEDQE